MDRFGQEPLLDEPDRKISLQIAGPDFPAKRLDESGSIGPGSMLVWYLWGDRDYEVGAFYHPSGTLLGYYVNFVRPPVFEPGRWVIDDLYLDIWVPAGGEPRLLDEDELTAAVAAGSLDEAEADGVREAAARILARIRAGRWQPPELRRWPAEHAGALRLRRDRRGAFHAARISGRVIAFGLYVMGAVSATSIAFAYWTDAFTEPGTAQEVWKLVILAEALILLPLAMSGRLPATFWPRPALVDERSLFIATLASGLAVLSLNQRTEWAGALLPVYGTLGAFSTIFAVCRVAYDRVVPWFALAGMLVTLAALWALS